MADDSRMVSFMDKGMAYTVKSAVQSNHEEYIHVDKQVVFESVEEWGGLD